MTPADSKSPDETIKVTDRRLFTPEGERRDATPSEPEPSAPTAPGISGEGFTMRPGAASRTDFASLVVLLSSTALINLGGAENPVSGKIEVNLDSARQMIDFLDVLRDKTRGNLSPSEAQMLDCVYELKLLYTRQTSSR